MIMACVVFATVTASVCHEPKLVGFTAPLTVEERQSLKRATVRCGELYPEAPCLKVFRKREERVFWAICGESEALPLELM